MKGVGGTAVPGGYKETGRGDVEGGTTAKLENE
jgi:hypothetical protein